MPRRKSEWDDSMQSILSMHEKSQTVEEREHVPEKACGKCKNFSAVGWGTTSGRCIVLKTGSDIMVEPPVFVLEGEVNITAELRMDASRCTYFEEMQLIETDIAQAYDPRYSRHLRQMQTGT